MIFILFIMPEIAFSSRYDVSPLISTYLVLSYGRSSQSEIPRLTNFIDIPFSDRHLKYKT